MNYSVAAGRFNYDKENKKVKVSRDKGIIKVYRNEVEETHFSWVNTDTKLEQVDLIVFPNDAIFQPLSDKNNTFILKFTTDDDRYFFWLQEKKDPSEVLKQINKIINYEFIEQQQMQSPSMQIQKLKPSEKPKLQGMNQQFIKKMQQNIAKHNQKYQHTIKHLDKIITIQAINIILNQTSAEQKNQLIEYLPEEHKNIEYLSENLKSPQFLQALDTLSDALNSQNIQPLFMELGLDQKFLNEFYGIYAFLKAFDQKIPKQSKMEEQVKQNEQNKDISQNN